MPPKAKKTECRTREKKDGGTYKICYKPGEKAKPKRKKRKLVRKEEADATRAKAEDFLGDIAHESPLLKARQELTMDTAPKYGIDGAYSKAKKPTFEEHWKKELTRTSTFARQMEGR